MSDLRELLGDDDYEATIDKAVETAERYFHNANYTHPREGVARCEYGCGVQLIERTIEHVTARILEAVLPELFAQAWDEGADFVARHPDMSAEYVRAANPYRKEIDHE